LGCVTDKGSGDENGVGAANLAAVKALTGSLLEATAESLAPVVEHLDDHGRCLLLLSPSPRIDPLGNAASRTIKWVL
jgi:hypothetical protein